MGRKAKIEENEQARARQMAAEAKNVEELRMAQAILLPGPGRTLEQAGQIMGVSRRTVIRLREAFRHGKQTGQRGGRRHELMSLEQEKAFLERWRKQAQAGELVVAAPMREALSAKLGRPVAESTLYRMLMRQGWRKVAPDTRHPKASEQTQQDWKKNSWKNWVPPNSQAAPMAGR